MSIARILIANRAEIAIRIARAAQAMGAAAVAVSPRDDARCLHVRRADEALVIPGQGAAAYLDGAAIVEAARTAGCGAVHPGYGFLSERADFAAACAEAGLIFIGPAPDTLALFGDKRAARQVARDTGVPVAKGSDGAVSLDAARAFLADLGPGGAVMLKALYGGGGRGMRAARTDADLIDVFARCEGEALNAFGRGDLYVEEYIPQARHIEVQILGDGTGAVSHLGERECSLQRRHQKIVEIAPAPALDPALRARLCDAAVSLGQAVRYKGAGTVEFLVRNDGSGSFVFIEANPRLQVEHTVTEEVTGVDLVRAQIALAGGATLADLGLSQADIPAPAGFAIQARINTEHLAKDGSVRPKGGTLSVYEPATGPGIRVDGHGYAGYTTHPGFDSLLAKMIVHDRQPSFEAACARLRRALDDTRIEGVGTNLAVLRTLLARPEIREGRFDTTTVETLAPDLIAGQSDAADPFFSTASSTPAPSDRFADAPSGTTPVPAPMQGTLAQWQADEGAAVHAGAPLCILEAMKMEHVIAAPVSGIVRKHMAAPGETVLEAAALAYIEPADIGRDLAAEGTAPDPDHIRADLAEVRARHAYGLDEHRPDAVARRRKTGQRTARENIDDLCDPGTFIEYGALAVAAQRRRRSIEDLIEKTPADGLIGGFGSINGAQFPEETARTLIMSYDYTVLAGTQGAFNHKKTDRLLSLAERWRAPVVFFTEGGGGRPGDTDSNSVAGLDVPSFAAYARLSGLMPRLSITSGRCFAGNAAFAGCSDITIVTRNANLGMGGPAMIEGGGLGVFKPEDIGPIDVQTANGVVDLAVEDEAEAVTAAKRILSCFQGPIGDWTCADQRLLRHAIPENRLRVYDIRTLIALLADDSSVIELRRDFAPGMITALIRIEGRPFGLIANNPMHLAGAIDSDGADKAARFMQLCDAFDVPLVSLCDTPGIMVGPEAEKTGLVRHAARMFVTAASLTVPVFAVVLRKGYGLGAQTMTGGGFHESVFTIAWPSGEFGGMGLEGAVRLGYRKELEAAGSPEAQEALFKDLVAKSYERGKATNMASYLEIDAVIDPADTRAWILRGLASVPAPSPRTGKKRPMIDTW